MTQEEKYKKALLEARAVLEPCLKYSRGKVREALDSIDKELKSFESEDERILRVISEAVITFFSDYANDFEDEERDAALAWLEKQKENPKSADSIQSNCTSDAKCEDRWHKVSDSLPDNGRLVLANDCLGNTLLARYDGEGNWEVSVYDNEDYYCRNTITKWCEIPSEKQKEQKPKAKAKSPLSPHELYDAKIEGISQGRQDVLDHPEQFGLQKPAEWSEDIIQKAVKEVGLTQHQINWFKTNVFPPKQEWSEEDELTKKHLEGYIKGRNDVLREMSDFMESHFNTNKAKEGEDLTDLYYKEYVRNPQPIPSGWGCDGTHCTNPQMDCINCPRKTTGGSFSTSSASGTSAATLHGNTSVTDGKPHNPSFTD